MQIEITEEERELILRLLNSVSVQSKDGMLKVLALMEKFEHAEARDTQATDEAQAG